MSLKDSIRRAVIVQDHEQGTMRLRFAGDEEFFAGHFPGNPILPAVVQIAAASYFASELTGQDLRVAEVPRAKFMHPTGPGQDLDLALQLGETDNGQLRARATIHHGNKPVAEFNLRLTQVQ
jgi:3-hydroxyacyl-[acyl-carrier-protein] dehydratase